MIINYYALDLRIYFSLRVCFAQLPSQSIISQDSELAVFEQKLKSDSVNPQPITFSDFFFIKVDPNIKLAWV